MPYKDQKKQKQAQHKHYLENKEDIMARSQIRRLERKRWYREEFMRGRSCQLCPENIIECLDWHHVDPATKLGTISEMLASFRPIKRILDEVKKCVLVCANCHRKIHAGLLYIPNGD